MDHSQVDAENPASGGPDDAVARNVEAPKIRPAPPRSDRDFAVVVGVEHYSNIRTLQGAHEDATSFHRWLCDENGGGLEPENAELILSDSEAETPFQVDIDRKLLVVLGKAHALGGARRLYFYFSGHGATDEHSLDDVALLLTQWERMLARIALSTHDYSYTMRKDGIFEEVAIFIDCCRTQSFATKGLPPLLAPDWKALPRSTRRFIAFASEPGQPAFESPAPEAPDRRRGIFTQCLLSILGQAPNGVPAALLKDRLEREVADEARSLKFQQHPRVHNEFEAPSSFGLGGRLPVLQIEFSRRSGQVTLCDGRFVPIRTGEAGPEPWRLELPIGIYRIEGGGPAEPSHIDHDGRKDPHVV
jgi:hypothetical protein